MAEFVVRNVQEMVPELEQLELLKLMSNEDRKELTKRKIDFEYSTMRGSKSKDDFIAYVMFEIKLLEQIRILRKEQSCFQKFGSIEQPMQVRILRRLIMMTQKWKADLGLWQLRIFFSKSRNMPEAVSNSYKDQLSFHSHSEDLWIAWAQWEIEGRANFIDARQILLSQAASHIRNSAKLSREHFRLELLYIEYLKMKNSINNLEGTEEIMADNEKKVLKCVAPEYILDSAVATSQNPELFFEFYNIANKFPFAHSLRDKIYKRCLEKYPDNTVVWKLKAMRAICGLSECCESDEASEESNPENSDDTNVLERTLSTEEKLLAILRVYGEAMQKVGISFLPVFLDQMFDLLHQCWGINEFLQVIVNKMFDVFESSSEALSNQQFLIWFELASHMKRPVKILRMIISEAKTVHPKCDFISLVWLRFRLGRKPELKINHKNFLEGLRDSVGADICMELVNNSSRMNKIKMKKLMHKAAYSTDAEFSKQIRVKHLLYLRDDMKLCRKYYAEYNPLPMFFADIHAQYIMMELRKANNKPIRIQKVIKEIRVAFGNAVRQFGSTHAGVWLSYMEFERRYGDNLLVTRLWEDAKVNLTADKFHKFLELDSIIDKIIAKNSSGKRWKFCNEDSIEVEVNCRFWNESSNLGSIVEEETLAFSVVEEREKLFQRLARIAKRDDVLKSEERLRSSKAESCWERLLSLMIGEKISLSIKPDEIDDFGIEKDTKEFFERTEKQLKDSTKILKINFLSDTLRTTASVPKALTPEVSVDKALKNSEILKPEFIHEHQVAPFHLSIKVKKAMRKRETAKTMGKGWFNMKAPEITPEIQMDLDVTRMRSFLQSDSHYKRNDFKETPKFFQIGKVMDSKLDFYSSRLTKKERKRTLAEEVMNDPNVIRHQKNSYSEVTELIKSKKLKLSSSKKENLKSNKEKRINQKKMKNKRKTHKEEEDTHQNKRFKAF